MGGPGGGGGSSGAFSAVTVTSQDHNMATSKFILDFINFHFRRNWNFDVNLEILEIEIIDSHSTFPLSLLNFRISDIPISKSIHYF